MKIADVYRSKTKYKYHMVETTGAVLHKYGIISPPKFKVCFRCSSLQFSLVLHHATFEFYIQHCCLRCDIELSQWDIGVLTFFIQVLIFNIQVSSFNIQVLNWTSRMNGWPFEANRWERWAQGVTQAWHKTHRSLHGSTCRIDSNATNARSTLRRVAEQLLAIANEGQ